MQKQKHKNKEELIKDAEIQKEVIRKRNKAKDELYPLLLRESKNIEDASVFCQSVGIAINQAFNNKKRELKIKDLNLISQLDEKGKEYARYKAILEMFAEENLKDALEVINGMPDAISGFIREETLNRKLDSLKTNFL